MWIDRTILLEDSMTTEQITIPVSPGLAKAYGEADPQQRLKLALMMEMGLQSAIRDTRTLQEVMRDIGRKARERGMTPEILESILNDTE
jgi:hypothetical protein